MLVALRRLHREPRPQHEARSKRYEYCLESPTPRAPRPRPGHPSPGV